jgi:hypothetical protein
LCLLLARGGRHRRCSICAAARPTSRPPSTSRPSRSRDDSRKTTEAASTTSSFEDKTTARTVNEAVNEARRKRGGSIGGTLKGITGSISSSTEKDSKHAKEGFREAVTTALSELKNERSVEIASTESEETVREETGKLVNPNDEVPATYAFYELQRRFRVSETIQQLTPVVLVAQEVPAPHEITRAWILQHDWILRRVLLDPTFLPALEYVRLGEPGAEVEQAELARNLEVQRQLVADLKEQIGDLEELIANRYLAFGQSVGTAERSLGRWPAIAGFPIPTWVRAMAERTLRDTEDPEQARLREEMAREELERKQQEERQLRAQLQRELATLAAMTDRFTAAYKEYIGQKVEVARLRLHIKQNILYYMQAIWDAEPPDQRFFRLHEVAVPRLEGQLSYSLSEDPDPDAMPQPPLWTRPLKLTARAKLDSPDDRATLAELADLDNLLGYKGNYMIFPLARPNVLTKYMMVPYADARAGLQDPDPFGNFTLEQLDRYVCCLKDQLADEDFDALRPGINEAYQRLLAQGTRLAEEVVVPTDSLLIQAAPSGPPLLEEFQLRHRAVDVERAAAKVQLDKLEVLRLASRIVDANFEDPSTDKVIIKGSTGSVVIDTGSTNPLPSDDG